MWERSDAIRHQKEEMIKTISKFNLNDVFQDPELFIDLDVELTNIVNSNDPAKSTSIFAIKKDGIFGIAFVCDDEREEFFPEEMETPQETPEAEAAEV